ncbi:MAG: hypothetical protein P857_158 [Candidatus Xenolissoclinum pacificiensis L6]|uniref:DUF2460 domain-containing protein n=1 Tax=Candidatus Xenolissoclinum pacificiensis L6 TaxID=1401685 RepID=W2V0U5_9RICK|nr:MAG: hypothetical protein P857_158 [Candidatus Xenolissoclinum pacificiensis L6]
MTITFSEIRFPENISAYTQGGPSFSTEIVQSANGLEQRYSKWYNPINTYNVSHGIKTQQQMEQLLKFFYVHKGRYCGFRFKDILDYYAHMEHIGTTDGISQKYQIIKKYQIENMVYIRKIFKPVPNTVSIQLENKTLQPTEYSIDHTQGLIIFNTIPQEKQKIFVSYEFDVPVRFESDQFTGMVSAKGFYTWNNIILQEIKL